MTTTDGYIRQITHILSNDQHAVHNLGNICDLLREVAQALQSEQKMRDHWVSECANMESQRNRCRDEIVRLRSVLSKIAWSVEVQDSAVATMEKYRNIAIDALAIGKASL
jgi:hypothetical protein